MSGDVEARLAALASLDAPALRAAWCREVGHPVPKMGPKLMRLALAWKIQAKAYGGLPRATSQKLDQLTRGLTKTQPARADTRLVREWNGVVHVVTIGFLSRR